MSFSTFNLFAKKESELKQWLKEQGLVYATSPDGIYYSTEERGEGERPKSGQFVAVHYTGKFLSGEVFDSSVERLVPLVFQIGKEQVIKGWDKGIPLYKKGGSGTLYLEPKLAYGNRKIGPIPANSPLIFDIELLGVFDTKAEADVFIDQKKAEAAKIISAKKKEKTAAERTTMQAYADKQGLKKVKTTPTGLMYVMEEKGTGVAALKGQTVSVHYKGSLLNGMTFDSSYNRGEPISFILGEGQVIQGWDEGVALLKVGGKATFLIPSALAYGERAVGPIPANSILRFDVELMDVQD